jgi:hypothetical protein
MQERIFADRLRRLRFSVRSVLVLILGIANGYSLNLQTLRLLIHGPLYPTALPPYVIKAPDILEISLVRRFDGDEAAVAGKSTLLKQSASDRYFVRSAICGVF